MASGTRLIVFNADEDYATSLRAELLGIEGVKIVAEVDEVGLLPAAVNQFACDVVVVHLDPQPDVVLHVASQVLADRPGLAMFGISGSQDGQMILSAFRSGFREFLVKPFDTEQLAEALGRVVQTQTTGGKTGKLIAVINSIGGAGATTVATNLAVELADLTKTQVALVDMDFRFGQIATFLDVQPNYTVADLCDTPEQCDQSMIEKAMVKHASGVHVLGRPNQFAQAEQVSAAHCGGVLSSLQELYDYVVVDGPCRYDNGGKTILDMADVNLLVAQLLVTSIRSIDRILSELAKAGYNLGRIRLLCNKVGRDSGHLTLEHIAATIDQPMFHTIVDDWKSVSGAINMGEPLMTHAGKSKVRQCFRELAEKLHSPSGAAQNASGGKKTGGLLSKIFSE
ncbi:MAG: AAA family ATPase [Phycisphaerae bacterium]|nr:AAA family ATPase [Phycisphaerae bacterium]